MPEVELYGGACINPLKHPSDPTDRYPLMKAIGTGCGRLGADSAYSHVADS